jgi:hypothetical protein
MRFLNSGLAAMMMSGLMVAPIAAFAQHHHDQGSGQQHAQPQHKQVSHGAQGHGQSQGKTHRNNEVRREATKPPYQRTGNPIRIQRQDYGNRTIQHHSRQDQNNQRLAWDRNQSQEWNRSRNRQRPIIVQNYYQDSSWHDREWYFQNRRNKQNEWRNLAIGAGLVGVLGLVKHDNTLFFAGAAGALYSVYRLNEDRHSENRELRARAYYFDKPYFVRDGELFRRQTVVRDGHKYYRFCRS